LQHRHSPCPLVGRLMVIRDKREQDFWVRQGRVASRRPNCPLPKTDSQWYISPFPMPLPHIPRIQQQPIPTQTNRGLLFTWKSPHALLKSLSDTFRAAIAAEANATQAKTLQTLSAYYCLPVQPTDAVMVEGILLKIKSREVSLGCRCVRALTGRPLPILHPDLLSFLTFSHLISSCRPTRIFLELAGPFLRIRRVGFQPDCQTSTSRLFQRAPDELIGYARKP
jgi:hypothetical protein